MQFQFLSLTLSISPHHTKHSYLTFFIKISFHFSISQHNRVCRMRMQKIKINFIILCPRRPQQQLHTEKSARKKLQLKKIRAKFKSWSHFYGWAVYPDPSSYPPDACSCVYISMPTREPFSRLFISSLTHSCMQWEEQEPVIMLSVVARTFLHNKKCLCS